MTVTQVGTTRDEDVVTTLLQEHEELVQLLTHDDLLSWQLNLALIASNAGLLAGVQTQGAFDLARPVTGALVFVLLVGALLNVAGFFVLQRRKVHRLSRLYRALRVEEELALQDVTLQTFSSAEANIAEGRMLMRPKDAPPAPAPLPTRRLRFYERVTTFDLRLVFDALALTYLALLAWVALGRPVP